MENEQYVIQVKSVHNASHSLLEKLKGDFNLSHEVVSRIESIMLVSYKAGHEFANVIGPAEEWSNNACLGYAIAGAKKLKYTEKQVKELVSSIYGEFDWKTIDEAKRIYNKSPY